MNLPPPLSSHALIVAAVAVLIGWRLYRRVRRLIGRQPVRTMRLTMTAVLFPLLLVVVAASGLRQPSLVEGLVAGAIAGIALGLAGLRLTHFESTPLGFFYRPNTALGVAVSLLFVGRVVYRFGAIYAASGNLDPATLQSFGRSALTFALLGVVGAYYATSAIGVLAWYRKARTSTGAAPAALVDTPHA